MERKTMLEEFMPWLIYAIIAIIVVIVVAIFSPRYTVVSAHEAHVVVRRKGRTVYCSREGYASSYWFIPILQRRSILPLENIKIEIEDISLRDIDMAKFLGDVRVWLSIENPDLAAEKLGKVEAEEEKRGFPAIEADVKDLIEAVTRNSSMKMDVFEIMKNREKFSANVEEQVAPILKGEWGIKIADLEVIHFVDTEGYTVIKDLEKRQAKVIEAETRKQVAGQEKDATISEAIATQEKESKKAETEELYRKRQIEKDQAIGEAEQAKKMKISEAEVLANEKAIEAKKTLDVGTAEVEKQAAIVKAEGEAQSKMQKAKGDSEYTKLTGFAEADVSKQKLFAEAEGTEKKAVALKNYTDAGLSLEVIKANIEIKKAQFNALGEGLKVAKINIVTSGESNILGIPISAETGADLGAMLIALQNQGVNITDLLKTLPISETAKLAIAAKTGLEIVKEAEKEKKAEPEKQKAKK
jgi:flotillin